MTKSIAPKIADTAANFYPDVFRNLNSGATYALEAFPVLYRRTLYELRGRFDQPELMCIIDVFNATALTAGMAGQHLAVSVEDGINLDGLDKKWSLDKKTFLSNLAGLTIFQAACLEIWANGFWYSETSQNAEPNFEPWLKPLMVNNEGD